MMEILSTCPCDKLNPEYNYSHIFSMIGPILREKQKSLNLAENGLILDVKTRWNSTYDMIDRYLQQDSAVYAALNDSRLKTNTEVSFLTLLQFRSLTIYV